MSEQWEGRLREAAQKLTLSEEGRERILDGCNSRQKPVFMTRHRIKLAAALCQIVVLTLFSPGMNLWDNKDSILVYASTEDGEWNRLEIGEKQRLVRIYEAGTEQCVLLLQLPGGYRFESEGARIGEDHMRITKGRIYWIHHDEDEKVDGKASLRLVFTDADGNRVDTMDALELLFSREEGECYAELRRIQ